VPSQFGGIERGIARDQRKNKGARGKTRVQKTSVSWTLISVDQLFTNSGAEARFGDHRCIYVPDQSGQVLRFPFTKGSDGLFVWRAKKSSRTCTTRPAS
jgi:hypothetical protein